MAKEVQEDSDEKVLAVRGRLAALIKSERKKRGLSQDRLAWRIGLSKITVQSIERERSKNPTLDTLLKVCYGLGLKFSELAKRIE